MQHQDLRQLTRYSMSVACQHPVRFRSLLLIAASYYAWNAGGLYDFQSTYLYHMSRCIRQVNEWLKQSGEIVFRNKPCVMELIACLSITEVCVPQVSHKTQYSL